MMCRTPLEATMSASVLAAPSTLIGPALPPPAPVRAAGGETGGRVMVM